jgi:hypothetical protein
MLKSEKTDDPIFHWFEKGLPGQRLRINNGAGYADDATSFVVDTTDEANGIIGSKAVRKGMTVLVERTGEILYVSADPTTDTGFDATRAFGETAAAALVDDDWLLIVGTVHEEGGAYPTAVGFDPSEHSNYTQIFRSPMFMTRTAMKTRLRTGDQVKQAKREALEMLSIQKERALIFGELKAGTGTKGQPMRSTRGLIRHITNGASGNIIDVGGALSESEWDGYMEQLFRYGSTEKLALCGSTALMVLATMAKKGGIQMQMSNKDETYGMNLVSYLTPFGTLMLKSHPLFNEHPVHRTNMLIVDPANITERYVDDIRYLQNRQTAGDDAQGDEYLNEAGLEVWHAKTHMYLKTITSFAP